MSILDKIKNNSGSKPTTANDFYESITPSSIIENQILQESISTNEYLPYYKDIESNTNIRINKIANPNDIFSQYESEIQRIAREEEIAKAKNQSNWAKAFNSLEQLIVNEVILGSLEGIFNLGEMLIEGTDTDFNNPIGNFFNDLQEKNKELFAIHRENPNESWNVSDFGWWAEGLVTVGSFASMLIPAAGTTKAIGALGKAMGVGNKVNKGLKLIANTGKRVQKGKKLLFRPNLAYNNLKNFSNIAGTAVLSRLGESYIESKDTYDYIYENTYNELQNFTNEEREAFIERNPNYANMSDEDIAKDLAKISADENFSDDMKLVILDFIQIRGLSKIFQNRLKNLKPNAITRIQHRNSMKALQGLGEETFEKINLFTRSKEWLSYGIKHPLHILGSLELTEGFEEGYQGIAQDRAKDYYRMAFDPEYTPRTLSSYLTDGHIWEQAFWGVVGGIGMKGMTYGAASIKEKVQQNKENKKLTETQQKERLSNEKVKESVINDRFEKLRDYAKKMQSLNAGRHYSEYETKEVPEGQAPEFRKLTEEEVLLEKQKLTNEFITDFVFNSIESGTFDLTREFIESEYFGEYLKKNGVTENDVDRYINQNISEQIDKVKKRYDENFQLFLNNLDYGTKNDKELNYSVHLLKMAARNITRLEMDIDSYENIDKDINNSISKLGYAEALTDGRYDKVLNTIIKNAVDVLDHQISEYDELFKEGKISKSARDQYVKDINDRKVEVLGLMSRITSKNENIKKLVDSATKIKNELSKTKIEDKNTAIKTAIADYNGILKELSELYDTTISDTLPADIEEEFIKKANNYLRLSLEKSQIPTNKDALIQVYKELAYGFDKYTTERIDNAFKLVGDYIENSENPDQAYSKIMAEDESLSKEMKDALEILKIGYDTAIDYRKALLYIVQTTKAKIAKKQADERKVNVDNTEVTDENAKEKINQTVDDVIDGINDSDNEAQELSSDQEEAMNVVNDIFDEGDEGYSDIGDDYFTAEGNDFRVKNYISDFIIKHSKKREFFALIEQIKSADMSDPNYKALYNAIVNDLLKDYSMSIEEASLIAKEEIHSVFTLFVSTNTNNPSKRQKFSVLAQQLSHQIAIQKENDMFSVTSIIENTPEAKQAKINLIKDFILAYRELYDIQGDVLNVDEFFEYLLENPDINYSTLVSIFNHFDFIISENIIKVENLDTYKRNKQNTSNYFKILLDRKTETDIKSKFMHISAPTAKNEEYFKALEAAKNGAKVTIEISNKNSYTLSVMCNGVEIGFITKTKTNSTKTEYRALTPRAGLDYVVSLDSDGKVVSNYDKLFKEIKEQTTEEGKRLYNILVGHAKSKLPINNTIKEELKQIFEKLGYKELADKIDNIEKDYTFAILNDIENVIFNKDAIFKNNDIYNQSYQNWLDKIYENYSKTYEINQELLDGKELTIDIKQVGYITPNFTTKEISVSSQPFNTKDFTVFGINKHGIPITETTNENFNPVTIFSRGEMGILLNNFNGHPIIAKFNKSNTVASNEVLKKLVTDELNKILTDYFQNNIDYEQLYKELKEILATNPLFYGYKLIKNNKGLLITKGSVKYWEDSPSKSDKNIVVAIYKESKKGKETKAVTLFNKEGKPYANIIDGIKVPYSEFNPKYIKSIAETLVEGLYFNMSMMPLNQKNKRNYKDNKHFYKENGKLILEFGDTKLEYNNYLEFIMAHNCFCVNVVADSNGNFFKEINKENSLYVDIKHYHLDEKADLNEETNINKGIELLEQATKRKSASVEDILKSFGYDQDYIDYLTNPIPGEKITIINDKVYYDKSTDLKYDAVFSKGKITITSRGITQIRKSPNNLIRLLAHENLHRHIEKLNAIENEYIINDLLDTYNQFIEALEKDVAANKKEAIALKRWIEANNFYPDNKFIKNDNNNVKFVEEWLVESVTRPEIANYLNNILYKGDVEVNRNLTLFQKILMVLAELLGFDLQTLNKNSILAKQISIFNAGRQNKITPIEVNNDNEVNVNTPVEESPQESVINQPEDNEANGDPIAEEEQPLDEGVLSEEELNELEDDTDFYSSTLDIENNQTLLEHNLNDFADNGNVNTRGYSMVSNMQKFLEQYPPKYRSILQQKLENGTLNFICQ